MLGFLFGYVIGSLDNSQSGSFSISEMVAEVNRNTIRINEIIAKSKKLDRYGV